MSLGLLHRIFFIAVDVMHAVHVRFRYESIEILLRPLLCWWFLHKPHNIIEAQLLQLIREPYHYSDEKVESECGIVIATRDIRIEEAHTNLRTEHSAIVCGVP